MSALFAQAKLYIYGAIAGLIAILYGWGKYQSSKKEEAQEEAKVNKTKAESLDKRIEAHETRKEVEQSNVNSDVDAIDDGLRDYYRD